MPTASLAQRNQLRQNRLQCLRCTEITPSSEVILMVHLLLRWRYGENQGSLAMDLMWISAD